MLSAASPTPGLRPFRHGTLVSGRTASMATGARTRTHAELYRNMPYY
jgi:hypothetical protein